MQLPDSKSISPRVRRGAIGAFAALLGLGVWFGWRQCQVNAIPPPPVVAQPAEVPIVETLSDAGVADAKVIPTTATIVFATVPQARATVSWGKKRLGNIMPNKPLVIVRPRDSGPLDVIVRADGFLPVHTRAHTFSDNKVMIKLTRPDQTSTLLGYRVPLDAGLPENLDLAPSTSDPAATDPAAGAPVAPDPIVP